MKSRNIKKILLLQPNYAWLNKRTLRFPTYTLALLKACLDTQYETTIFDPNFNNLSEDEVFRYIKKLDPNLVGITSNSTEYLATSRLTTSITRRALPNAIIVLGGVMPTVLIEEAMKDENVDYWIMGEGEYSFPHLINELQNGKANLSNVNGLAYWKDGKSCINKKVFIEYKMTKNQLKGRGFWKKNRPCHEGYEVINDVDKWIIGHYNGGGLQFLKTVKIDTKKIPAIKLPINLTSLVEVIKF